MSVLLETSIGEIVVDLDIARAPKACLNFIKLCKIKYYNYSLVHSVRQNFICQMGDPTETGFGGESVFVCNGQHLRYFAPEITETMNHRIRGTVSMATKKSSTGMPLAASGFFITLADDLTSLDGEHGVIGRVVEGLEVLDSINKTLCDSSHRPFRDVRILHTIILDDPFDDPENLVVPGSSPLPTAAQLKTTRILHDEILTTDSTAQEIEKASQLAETQALALTLEMIGDLPFAEVKPPQNVLFVCKLNPVTRDSDLELIFARFGKILSCEIVRDPQTSESMCYAFIEFEKDVECEEAYSKMVLFWFMKENVLIDDRRIHVDFSQSVAKLHTDFVRIGQRTEYGEGLEKKSKYRHERSRDPKYRLLFDHDSETAAESKKQKLARN